MKKIHYRDIGPTERLTDVVCEILHSVGHSRPNTWMAIGLHPDALTTPNQDVQRFLINRSLRQCLATSTLDTMSLRLGLSDKCSLQDWLYVLKTDVCPFMAHENLPAIL